ncbi:hypothetical protein IV203_019765 [Nitzschia inconspicua]|uniref:Uncharacterized protein n=1 Tax=Nitzschia inconspicua TaxID=303405 RepID=A0A9K3LZ95_9STRA|nr:hypothetical protein IV203_019765 [Nitzschia inconspicua]
MNNTIPLNEALPWSPTVPRNVLICDSIDGKGDFVLQTMVVSQLSSSSKGRVFWLSGTSLAEQQIASSLKRMGCTDQGLDQYIRDRRQTNNITDTRKNRGGLIIRSLSAEVANQLVENADDFQSETYLKEIYKNIKEWLQGDVQSSNAGDSDNAHLQNRFIHWIVLDDVSSMATVLGEKLVYGFVSSLLSLSHRLSNFGILLRCSNDVDQLAIKVTANEGKDQSGWVGAGGMYHKQYLKYNINAMVPWERVLESMVDAVVDVLPLPSGFSRDAHGRLIFTETPAGRGWGHEQLPASKKVPVGKGQAWNKLIVNYCIHDSGVRAIRLRETII